MTGHVVYPCWDQRPATLSRRICHDLLRRQLGFDGVLFSDDLDMGAVAARRSPARTAVAALEAGCDMVLICNDRAAASAAVGALRDYSNPPSLVRLARLHGTGQLLRESLLASDEWQAAAERLQQWSEPPVLELDA